MYNYDEIYEKIIKTTDSVNLSSEESLKIVDKIYKDLEIGLLKPRNITKKANMLICNSFASQNKQKENLTIEHHKVNAFLEKIKTKIIISKKDLNALKERLMDLNEISEQKLTEELKKFLKETNNNSLKMIKNYSFRDLNQAIISLDNSKIQLHCFIDHEKGILFELLTEKGIKNHILTRKDVENEIIHSINKNEFETSKYDEIRSIEIIDKFRDVDNPDIITVKFIDSGRFEYLKVKLECVIGCKLIGNLIEEPRKVSKFSKGDEVLINYCYDYFDNIHVYVKKRSDMLTSILKELSNDFKNASKEVILEKLYYYKYIPDFEIIIDTFHIIIFDYFRDLSEFYKEINKRKC